MDAGLLTSAAAHNYGGGGAVWEGVRVCIVNMLHDGAIRTAVFHGHVNALVCMCQQRQCVW